VKSFIFDPRPSKAAMQKLLERQHHSD